MSFVGNNYDFLREISPANIAKAKTNFQLRFNNYTTIYAVDPYDIFEFCFPLVFNTSIGATSQLSVSNFLSYQLFFFEYPQKPVLFDEYKVELYSFWYKVKRNLAEFSNYESLKDTMIDQYRDLKTKHEKILFIESNIGMLLAMAFGAISNTPVDRYNDLIQNRLQVGAPTVENGSDSRILEDIFYETKIDKGLVSQAFTRFCDTIKYQLLGRPEDERSVYLENSLRDIKVFDRIIGINRKLTALSVKKQLKEKYNILYLSSAVRKADLIEKFYADYLPSYEGVTSDSIHRSNIEVYLSRLLDMGDSEENKATIINFLDKLEGVSKSYLDNADKIEKYRQLFSDNTSAVNVKLLEGGRDIDDIFLKYHSIRDHREKINKAIGILRATGDDVDLLIAFTDVLGRASEFENRQALKQLEKSLVHYNKLIDFKSDIVTNLTFLKKRKDDLKIQVYPGKDAVRSLIQSFPILLFYKKKSIAGIQRLFKEIISPGEKSKDCLYELTHTPQHLLFEFSPYEKYVFFLFIRYLFDSELKADSLIEELDFYLELNSKAGIDIERPEKTRLEVIFRENENLRNDIYYLQTWILRRDDQHDLAIQKINSLQATQGSLDVRLYHSRALCYKNKYYKESGVEGADILTEYLLLALADFEKCELGYNKMKQDREAPTLIVEILSAISNSIIDTYTKLYILNKTEYEKLIVEGRQRLILLKKNIPETGYDYDLYPAFGHTEIDLEFCESLIALSQSNIKLAVAKISEAIKRMELISDSDELWNHEPFEKSKSNVRKLAKILIKN